MMDVFSQVLLALAFLLPSIGLIWAISIFVWGVRSGGNWRNPGVMFEYFANLFFYRLRYNHQQRRRAYHQSVVRIPAAPDKVSALSTRENEFFFLHEATLETGINLRVENGNEVLVSKRDLRKLTEYFQQTSSRATAHGAFANFGLDLRVANSVKRTPAKSEKFKAE